MVRKTRAVVAQNSGRPGGKNPSEYGGAARACRRRITVETEPRAGKPRRPQHPCRGGASCVTTGSRLGIMEATDAFAAPWRLGSGGLACFSPPLPAKRPRSCHDFPHPPSRSVTGDQPRSVTEDRSSSCWLHRYRFRHYWRWGSCYGRSCRGQRRRPGR